MQREGEKMGEIDFKYDFLQHYQNYCSPPEEKKKMCDRCITVLRELVNGMKKGKKYKAKMDGYWHEVFDTGMYDGWPWWREVPHICIDNPYSGSTWEPFYHLREIEEVK